MGPRAIARFAPPLKPALINIGKGVIQGCILSPLLFNIYTENITALEDWDGGISIGGRRITNLRYAGDTTLIAETKNYLIAIMERVKLASEKAGLYLNVGKTEVMVTEDQLEMVVDGKYIEVVSHFIFLRSLITKDGFCEKEIRRRLAMGRSAMVGLMKILKDRGITLRTKIRLVKALVFPIVLYGAESWTMRQLERNMIDAFELWCWRRLIRITWTDRKTNVWVIDNIKPEWTLESRIVKESLYYFIHVIRAGGLEYEVMLGRMGGYRSRGRPRQRWLDSINKNFYGTIFKMIRASRCRRNCRAAVIDVARGRI